MENQIEKSIERIALEDYVWKIGTAKLSKESNRVAFIIGGIIYVLSIIFFAYDSVVWNYSFAGILSLLFICIFPGLMGGVIVLCVFVPFFGLYRGKRKTKKVIATLSNEDKKKIVKDYIKAEIKKWQDNITYCEKKISPLQDSIKHNRNEIEKLSGICDSCEHYL